MSEKKEERPDGAMEKVLSLLMLWGVLASAAIMLLGGVIYLFHHAGGVPGDHVFRGEPQDLRDPFMILKSAAEMHTRSVIQLGVVVLLLNPFFRVILAFFGYLKERDFAYLGVSGFLIAILIYSFFA